MRKDAELIQIFGRRGSGKSTLTKGLLKGRPKVVVFDPRAEYVGSGWTVTHSRTELLKAMRRGWSRGFRIAYVPPSGDEIEALHKLTLICWAAQSPYEDGRDTRKLTLVVEEADLSYPSRQLPVHLSGMTRVVNQGRHVGIECIAVSQRPAQISATYRANVATSYLFALAADVDRQEMLRLIGRDYADRLRTLPAHRALVHENGQVRAIEVRQNGQIRPISI
ncbi:MAG: hypothetical protein Q7V31_16055 [Parvibaculum sp.]|uniref:hypothetical protein n=1 Tax=Parvibaculum sp. TaxID=2024848 RepID=UPI0027274C67|nr:hypothetical protein [Parvibaculum sp.]MDO8840427.1 hypothetical protein [Parvibaculum sp.]